MRLTTLLACLLGTVVLVAILIPASACGCSKAIPVCASNLKQMGTGMRGYAEDHDGRLPTRDLWMDEIKPYVKEERLFHDAKAPKGSYGYAFDSRLSGVESPEDAASAPLVYDSLDPIRNASDPFTSLPRPGRHEGKNGVAYADGHVGRVLTSGPGEAVP